MNKFINTNESENADKKFNSTQEKQNKFFNNNIQYNYNEFSLEKLRITHHPGIFSQIFGANEYTPIHIAGFIAIILVFSGIILSFFTLNFKAHWDIFLPIVSMCIGYIFGKI